MTKLTTYQYVTGEDGREFPHIPIGLADDGETPTFTGKVLNLGDLVDASENPDDTRFIEYTPPTPPLTAKQQKALDAQVAQQLAEQNAAREAEAAAAAPDAGSPPTIPATDTTPAPPVA